MSERSSTNRTRPRFTVASLNNVFKAPMLCAESDQRDCEPCTAMLQCCNHDRACHGSVQ
ncbi:MAG: hypothetical protein HY901_30680 [Deltaproteobacteria bacterium]|nr:hypothetical protein [Deltaproteobacteria bacterium]